MTSTLTPGKSRPANSAWASKPALFFGIDTCRLRAACGLCGAGCNCGGEFRPKNGSQDKISLTGAGQNHGHIIGLFRIADPIRHGAGNDVADAGERLVAMFLNQRDKPFLSELA